MLMENILKQESDELNLKKRFIEYFGGNDSGLRIFTAPGRVNLIGEHTDYNGGYVFPAALTMGSTVYARPRSDRQVNLIATDMGLMVHADLDRLDEYRGIQWGSYQLGVADELQKAGYSLTGCDLMYHDTVPLGAGLSSSAAIEVATALMFVSLGKPKCVGDAEANPQKLIDMVELALICQKAENNYVGVNCGIMDQFASAMGKKDHALLLNCRDLIYRHVPLDMNGYRLVIVNSNKKRSLGESKYNERRSQCEEALAILKEAIPGISCLGDITRGQFARSCHFISSLTLRDRVGHVIMENARVLKAVEALEHKAMNRFGKLMAESHQSLRDLYEVTGPELDALVEEALKIEGVLGSRMTGAGFGGCTVNLVAEEAVGDFIEKVGANYLARTGLKADFYVSGIGDGGREIANDDKIDID